MSDRVRDAFEALIERMEDPPTWEDVSVPAARPREVRRKRRPTLVAVSALVAVIVLGVLTVTLPSQPVSYQLPRADVAPGEVIVSDDPLIVLGTPAPEPQFDTSTLGEEIELSEVDDTNLFLTWARQATFPEAEKPSKVIIGGKIETGATVGMVVGALEDDAAGNTEWCILTLDALGGSVCAQDPDPDFQTPVFTILPESPSSGTLSWGPAPEGTSVVTLSYDDTSLWQQPVAGIVLFPLDTSPAELVITAFDERGNEIHTETHPGTQSDG